MTGRFESGGVGAVDAAEPWRAFETLYFLGVGGPVDAAGIGHVERFAWRFLVRIGAPAPESVLAFSTMPKLMAFTRGVNAATPQAVSTEALKVATSKIAPGSGMAIAVDVAPADFALWLGGGALVERVIPEIER